MRGRGRASQSGPGLFHQLLVSCSRLPPTLVTSLSELVLLLGQPGPQVWDKPQSSKKPKKGVPGPGSWTWFRDLHAFIFHLSNGLGCRPCHRMSGGTWAICRHLGKGSSGHRGLALPHILAKVGLPPCPSLRWVMDYLHNTTLRAWGPQSSTTFILISDAGASIVDVPPLHPPSVSVSRSEWGRACPSRGWPPQRPP